MEQFSKRSNEKNGRFLEKIGRKDGTLGAFIHELSRLSNTRMNSTFEKMKDEGDDRNNKIDEIIATMEKKFSMIEEPGKTKTREYHKVQEDQNHGKDVATGFHEDSTEQEVEQLLRDDDY